MARARKSKTELLPQADPTAQLDVGAFLAAAQPVLAELTADLLERADGDVGITVALKKQHAFEQREWTAERFEVWRRGVVLQVATAWLLHCVFVRTLEDRGLLERNRIAGPGAVDSQEMFQRIAPHLGEREYLLMVFRELEHFPATREIFDAEHNLVWQLGPSSTAAKSLLSLFRCGDPEQPSFRFGQTNTRFLGDLYQDVSAEIRARYALLQTPDFIEAFILDQTLDPAIEEFGLEETTIIDPTCGSGHFLLGAFQRFYEGWCVKAPNESAERTVERALGSVFGVDINPYAVAISRFRLTLAALDKLCVNRLADAPRLPLQVTAGDALWEVLGGVELELYAATSVDEGPSRFRLLDQALARDFLHRPHAAVVGNPPYINEKNPALREAYRKLYESAAGKYALSAPFMERFFQLGRPGAFVGQITANSFMKREFGKTLVQRVLPRVDLQLIINTSGASIPGHGSAPTVLVFGRRRSPESEYVGAVLARRGEPSTPDVAAEGLVWRSIAKHWMDRGFENEYITVQPVERASLARHPWSLEGGGAGDMKALLEQRFKQRLGDLCDSIGIASFTLEDDVYLRDSSMWARMGIRPTVQRPMVTGEMIRDWAIMPGLVAFFPYGEDFTPLSNDDSVLDCLWPYRTSLSNNMLFGGRTKVQGGLRWYEFGRLTVSKLNSPLTITFAFVATHNHFVLDRGGKIFKQTAPIIKLPVTATEDDHLALLAYLNSSTACFWMKQVAQARTVTSGDKILQSDPAKLAYEFTGTHLQSLPIPSANSEAEDLRRLLSLAIEQVVTERNGLVGLAVDIVETGGDSETVLSLSMKSDCLLRRAVALQEAIDVVVYTESGLIPDDHCLAAHKSVKAVLSDESAGIGPEERAFCGGGAHGTAGGLWPWLRFGGAEIECSMCKRRWVGHQGRFQASGSSFELLVQECLLERMLGRVEEIFVGMPICIRSGDLCHMLEADQRNANAIANLGISVRELTDALPDVIPFLVALRFSETGIEKHVAWRHTWDLQRQEDAGEHVGDIAVPPKYDPRDFRSTDYYRLRGKLDVPKERFISYPGCEADKDSEPIYGWAGWDHLQRAQALATVYRDRKTNEAWPIDRLVPMLAGILELLPWLKQWHNEPHPEFGPQGDFFEDWLDGELREHKLTRADLEAWRPTGRSGGKKASKKASAKPKSPELFPDDDTAAASEPAPKKRGRKKKTSA